MSASAPKDLFIASLDRCSSDEKFIPSFYERFLASSDEVRKKFMLTDFEKQNAMLLRSLRLAAGATAGDLDSLREVRERAQTHDRYHLDIEPRLYEVWLENAIATAADYDPEWNDSIEQAWRTILGHVINRMIRYY